jgi:hypothetical protein
MAKYSSNLIFMLISASRTKKLSWLLAFLLVVHAVTSGISLCYQQKGYLVSLSTPFGIFRLVYAALNLLICLPFIPAYYQHRVACARSNTVSDKYIKDILGIARLALFVECSAFSDLITLTEKSTFIQKLRISSFIKGAQIVIICCYFFQWEVLRRILRCWHLWVHGKIIALSILMFATLAYILSQQDGDIKANEDEGMNGVAMGLFGAIYGFICSVLVDWVVVHSCPDDSRREAIELQGG